MFKIGHTRWRSVRIAATSSNKLCANGNIGRKKRLFPYDDDQVIALNEHFKELVSLGEVHATRFVRNVVANRLTELVTCKNDDRNVYLPVTDGIRPCYHRYGHLLGWHVESNATGAIISRWEGEGKEVPIVSIFTCHRFWKKNYPNLKVSTPSEDICELCFRFANHSKFRLNKDLYPSSLEVPNEDTKREGPRDREGEEEEEQPESVQRRR